MHDGVLAKLAATVTRGVECSDVRDNVLDKWGGQGLLTEGQKRSWARLSHKSNQPSQKCDDGNIGLIALQ